MRDHFWLNARLGNLRFFRTQLSVHLVLDIDQEPTGHCCREGRDLQLASFLYLFLRLFGHYWQQHSAQNFYLHRTLFVGITVRYRIPKLLNANTNGHPASPSSWKMVALNRFAF
jgi:hypothetical protein